MARYNAFTDDQIEILQSNSYTKTVKKYYISLTNEAKQIIAESTEPAQVIMKKLGYDREVLGRRIDSIVFDVRKKAHAKEKDSTKERGVSVYALRKRIKELERENASLKQQLKKYE